MKDNTIPNVDAYNTQSQYNIYKKRHTATRTNTHANTRTRLCRVYCSIWATVGKRARFYRNPTPKKKVIIFYITEIAEDEWPQQISIIHCVLCIAYMSICCMHKHAKTFCTETKNK